jgi:hypothetical protein
VERHFHHDLESLRDRLSEMAGRAETALTKAMEAVRTRNPRLAEEVFADDPAIDQIELEVEENCLRFLGLQQPVARDLRFVVASSSKRSAPRRRGLDFVRRRTATGKAAEEPAARLSKRGGNLLKAPGGSLPLMADTAN